MKSSIPRAQVGDVIGIRLPETLVKAIDAKAKAEDRPRSFIARRLIVRGLEAERSQRTIQEAKP